MDSCQRYKSTILMTQTTRNVADIQMIDWGMVRCENQNWLIVIEREPSNFSQNQT